MTIGTVEIDWTMTWLLEGERKMHLIGIPGQIHHQIGIYEEPVRAMMRFEFEIYFK